MTKNYLEQLEDARDDLRRYRRGMRWAITAFVVSVASVLLGSVNPHEGLSIALSVLGSLGAVLSLVFGGVWLTVHMDKGGHPEKALRRAEREHLGSITDGG